MAARVKKKAHLRLPKLKHLETLVIGLSVAGITGFSLLAVAASQSTPSKITTNNKPATHKTTVSKSSKTTIPPAAVAVAPTTTVTKPRVSTPAIGPPATKVEPTVTPSPSSNVTGLTPTSSPGSSSSPTTSSPPTTGTSTPPTTTSYESTNWSGYLATNGAFTGVSGSWTAPAATGNGSTVSADATWIGIGGVSTSDLIQIGTENTISPSGQVSTAAFYELLPSSSQQVPTITVTPGDSLSASITEVTSGIWTMIITDNTNGETFTDTVSYASSNSSAEWIEEDPSYSRYHQVPFDNFGVADFAAASTVENGTTLNLNTSSAQPVTMVNSSNQPIATPSTIGSSGASFSVTRETPS